MKKNNLCLLFLSLVALSLSSCTELGIDMGEDRSEEYKEINKENSWIFDPMTVNYLWYDEMPELEYTDYFAEPEDFFQDVLSPNDKYSYFEDTSDESTRAIDGSSSYGFDFVLYVDPVTQSSSSTRRYARVIYVFPDSPASQGGLKRGDWISSVGGEAVTSNNYGYLLKGAATTMGTTVLNYDDSENIYWEEEVEHNLPASRKIEDNPFYVDTLYTLGNERIAYLMYNRFSTGPENTPSDEQYNQEMAEIFTKFKAQAPTSFILDLRYNLGGYISCAQTLASLLAPEEALGEVFCTLEFNNKRKSENGNMSLNSNYAQKSNLNLSKLHIITSNFTASASELIINCLRPYMGTDNVILLGTKTEGKNVASETYYSSYGFNLHPIVATLYNCLDQSDYTDGFQPTYEIDEFQYIDPYYPLGDLRELMLYNTVHLILYGALPDGTSRLTDRDDRGPLLPSPVYGSMTEKGIEGAHLN